MDHDITGTIIRSYSDIALGRRSSCGCDSDEHWKQERVPVPGAVKELNLGCGSPLDVAALEPGQSVLDLGSGSGREVFLAARAVGEEGRALGLDMTPAMIDLARANALTLGIRNAEFILGNIGGMPVESASIDRVISNCVINLAPDKERVFAEIHRVLRPGGRFAIADIVTTAPLPEEVRNDPELWCGCVAGALPVADYLGAISKAGFRDVKVVSQRGDTSCGGTGLGLLSITVTGVK